MWDRAHTVENVVNWIQLINRVPRIVKNNVVDPLGLFNWVSKIFPSHPCFVEDPSSRFVLQNGMRRVNEMDRLAIR